MEHGEQETLNGILLFIYVAVMGKEKFYQAKPAVAPTDSLPEGKLS